jgi:hypothetical protein
MKLSSSKRIVLALISMLGVTAGAGATATFAWFRTTRTSQINLTNAAVFGKGSIGVAYRDVTGGSINSNATNNDNGFDVAGLTKTVTDVSGNGVTMYKPDFNPNDAATIKNPRILSVDNITLKNYYICFGIDITNKGTETYGIYLNGGSVVEGNDVDVSKPVDTSSMTAEQAAAALAQRDKDIAQNTKNDRAAKATRVAFYTITQGEKKDSSGSVVKNSSGSVVMEDVYTPTVTWQQDTTDGTNPSTYKYLSAGLTSEKAADMISSVSSESSHVTSIAHESDLTYTNYDSTNLLLGSLKNAAELTTSTGVGSTRKICTVAGGATAKVNCSIWIEGSLSLATEECIGGQIKATFNLIAL